MFFMGTYTPKLDEKGRLFLPAKFRDRLAEGLVVTQGQENCLVVWPTDVFMEEARRAQATPMTVRGARDYARVLFAGADEGSLDKQGRIGIPAPLREYAALERDVVVIGVMDRIEIWDPARWQRVLDRRAGEVRRARRAARTTQQLTDSTTTAQRSAGRGLEPAPAPSGAPSPVPDGTFPSGSGQGPGQADRSSTSRALPAAPHDIEGRDHEHRTSGTAAVT